MQVAMELFGQRKKDLEGKMLAVILPSPYSLLGYIKLCMDAGHKLEPVDVSCACCVEGDNQ